MLERRLLWIREFESSHPSQPVRSLWRTSVNWETCDSSASEVFSRGVACASNVRDLPTFRDAYRRRRCIIPVDGFFERKAIKGQKAKQPYARLSRYPANDGYAPGSYVSGAARWWSLDRGALPERETLLSVKA